MPSLGKTERLKNRAQIHELYHKGKIIRGKNLNLVFLNNVAGRKIAIAVARGSLGSVERNKIKRRVREAYRQLKDLFPRRTHYMLIGKREVTTCDFESLQSEIARMALKVAKHGSDSP
jgi:ribonuclease P protein component